MEVLVRKIIYLTLIMYLFFDTIADWSYLKPWAGFYSPNIPILAYRFHITDLSNDYVRAEVFYFPLGKITVFWDGLYDIVKPLN